MSKQVLNIHNGILHRLVSLTHTMSEDERRDLHTALADADETLNATPEQKQAKAAAEQQARDAQRADLQKQLAALDAPPVTETETE